MQPSPYGTDNACILDAVEKLGKQARAVAVIPTTGIQDSTLWKMHRGGVRGVRINLQTAGVQDAAVAQRLLDDAAARVADQGWHVQTFASLRLLRRLELKKLKATLVIDHFGLPRDQDDCDHLVSLLRGGRVYVKLSAANRLAVDPAPLARALAAANPERCLWGSDWPHPFSGARKPAEVQPFDRVDDAEALARLRGWLGDEALFRKILVDNPARLYDF